MRKIIALLLLLTPLYIRAQNLQLHYDLGKERKFYTATLEMFRPDSMGSTYWFVDLDFNFPGSPRSMSATYWEISRDFYIPWLKKNPFLKYLGFHLEYNDGYTAYKDSGEMMGVLMIDLLDAPGLKDWFDSCIGIHAMIVYFCHEFEFAERKLKQDVY